MTPFPTSLCKGFPDSSVGKESSCSAGDPSSIPGSGRAPGEGTGYPLQYPWASLVAQLVKSPLAMQETWVQFLGKESESLTFPPSVVQSHFPFQITIHPTDKH